MAKGVVNYVLTDIQNVDKMFETFTNLSFHHLHFQFAFSKRSSKENIRAYSWSWSQLIGKPLNVSTPLITTNLLFIELKTWSFSCSILIIDTRNRNVPISMPAARTVLQFWFLFSSNVLNTGKSHSGFFWKPLSDWSIVGKLTLECRTSA